MQTIIKPAICPVWGKIWVTPYKRSAVRGKRSPKAINPGGVVYTKKCSTPPGSSSVSVTFLPELRFACTGLIILNPIRGLNSIVNPLLILNSR